MNFKLIKKAFTRPGPAISFPEEEKKIALATVFFALVLLFGGMFLFFALYYRSGFWGKNMNWLEKITTIATFVYIIFQFYDIIIVYGSGRQAIEDSKKPRQPLTLRIFLTAVLPVLLVYFVEKWLKANDYFGWFK
jgi:hypothetical protein